jgi:hypothetical protein
MMMPSNGGTRLEPRPPRIRSFQAMLFVKLTYWICLILAEATSGKSDFAESEVRNSAILV